MNGSATSSSLLVDFGDIVPDTSGTARWIMECSLSGKFTEFTADFTHSDELGGTLTSLLTGTDSHYLIHDVRVDLSDRDAVMDFLSKETPESGIYRVYESDNLTTDVTNPTGFLNCSGDTCTLTTTATNGCTYVKVADPFYREMERPPRSRPHHTPGRGNIHRSRGWFGDIRLAPQLGQAGTYPLKFSAFDGTHTAQRTAKLTIAV
ncbi:hypothetical protein [Desulfosarcina ovata]|uniref:hypothetical protein n=1 Tax=Desulfosarcina ovata TaxID=83564 RepID=UPI0012D2EC28|nr:hypothetical protein [Desulfosarcina ovata]